MHSLKGEVLRRHAICISMARKRFIKIIKIISSVLVYVEMSVCGYCSDENGVSLSLSLPLLP